MIASLIFGVLFSLFAFALFGDRLISFLRRNALRKEASGMGFIFSADENKLKSKDFYRTIKESNYFFLGKNPKISNVITGRMGTSDILLFDCEYYNYGGRLAASFRRKTCRLTFSSFHNESWHFPQFEMRPGGIFSRSISEPKNICFNERPFFSKKYYVKTKEHGFFNQLINENFFDYFENKPGFYIVGISSWLMISYKHKLIKPKKDNILFFGNQCLEASKAFLF